MANQIEHWVKWKPSEDINGAYYIKTMYNEIDNLIINLFHEKEKDRKIRVTFDNTAVAYKSIEEGYLLKTAPIFFQEDSKKLCEPWTFFKVQNSDFLRWLNNLSKEKTCTKGLIHFGFSSVNFIVDVAAINEPKIEIIKK